MLLRRFLTPILETSLNWSELASALADKGYDLAFREGHLVILNADSNVPVCTGRMLGVPLRDISARIGRPCVRAHAGGHSGVLAG